MLKWFLTGIGWAVGGPLGGILGFLVGSYFSTGNKAKRVGDTKSNNNTHRGPYQDRGTSGDLNAAILVLTAAVMKADGEVKRSELDYVKRFLRDNYGEDRAAELLKALREIVKKDIPVVSICTQVKQNTSYTTRYHLFDFLYGLAMADGRLDTAEIKVLCSISINLGINSNDAAAIRNRHIAGGPRSSSYNYGNTGYSQSQHSDPYSVLGISSMATDDEVKKSYRRLAMKYHPDKVEQLSEEVKKHSEAQFRKINEAYEQIKLARGMK